MATTNAASELSRLVRRMQEERQQHEAAIAGIDATFRDLGISPKPVARRGRKPGSTNKPAAAAAAPKAAGPGRRGRRGRRKAKDGQTAEQFLVGLLQDDQLSTSQINKKWQSSGRNGRADIMLGKLVAGGKLKREKVAGERGSLYKAS